MLFSALASGIAFNTISHTREHRISPAELLGMRHICHTFESKTAEQMLTQSKSFSEGAGQNV